MPISFDLEKLREKHNVSNYFETGLGVATHLDVSSKQALSCNFDKVFSMEIRPHLFKSGLEVYKNEIESGRFNLYLDDSVNMKKYLTSEDFKNKTIFFLDAHIDGTDFKDYKVLCPLFYEIEAIKSIDRKDNIILVDDLRIVNGQNPWGEKSYGNVKNFLDEIKKNILTINKDYKFYTLDGHVKDDVLVAYV